MNVLTTFRSSIVASALFVSSCATIMGEPTQTLPIVSSPSGAEVTITDNNGHTIFSGQTPSSITLSKSDGTYFGGKSFIVNITKPGYEPQIVTIDTNPTGWYIGGNILIGGLIGWLIVDPLSGNMYNLSTESVDVSLNEAHAQVNINEEPLHIALIDDIPEELRSKMVKIN